MNKYILSCLILATGTAELPAALVSYWHFNALAIPAAATPGNGGVPPSIAADQGSGLLDLSGWQGTVDDFAGSPANALGGDTAEESLSLLAGGSTAPFPGNGSFIEIAFSLSGFFDPVVTFVTRGTAAGFTAGEWAWSTGGSPFTVLAGVNTASVGSTFGLVTLDLSAIDGLDGSPGVILRYTLNGATAPTGNNRIDNLQINASPAPEPSTILCLLAATVPALRRRRGGL